MPIKSLPALLVGLYIITFPVTSSAYYIIHLKNGRQIITGQYWQQDSKILFDVAGNIAEIKENSVRNIDRIHTTHEEVAPAAEHITRADIPVKTKSNDTAEKLHIEEYRNKKEAIKITIDEVLEKYREASARQDKDTQEKLRQEITALSKQVFDINDEVKKRYHGELPTGWKQE